MPNSLYTNTVDSFDAREARAAVGGVGLDGTCGTVTIGGVVGAISDSPYTYEPGKN